MRVRSAWSASTGVNSYMSVARAAIGFAFWPSSNKHPVHVLAGVLTFLPFQRSSHQNPGGATNR